MSSLIKWKPETNRPKSIRIAIKLYEVALGFLTLFSICGWLFVFLLASESAHTYRYPYIAWPILIISSLGLTLLVFIGLPLFCLYMISQRRRWARIVMTLLTAWSALGVWSISGLVEGGIWFSLLGVVPYVLYVIIGLIAVVLLFTSESNIWFRESHR